jgi:hypothetical protein
MSAGDSRTCSQKQFIGSLDSAVATTASKTQIQSIKQSNVGSFLLLSYLQVSPHPAPAIKQSASALSAHL